MGHDQRPRRGLTEDELLLADMEGAEVARATVAYGRDRRRRQGLERWGQLQRIAEVYGLGELDAFDDLRLRVLHQVIGYVDEHVWRDTLAEVGRQILQPTDRNGWFPDLQARQTMRDHLGPLSDERGERAQPGKVDDEVLFKPDRDAIRGMTHTREEAVSRAEMHLAAEGSTMIVDDDYVHPNPYQDLWIVSYIDPQQRDEVLDGGGPIIVPAAGEVYALGSLPPTPIEMVGAILPPDDEWD